MKSADADRSPGTNNDESSAPYTPADFYRQCSDSRCEFSLFEGERIVQGVATWHPSDTGFQIVGDPAVISVIDDYAAHPEVPVQCYSVRILGRWNEETSVFFDVDAEYGIFGISAAEEGDTDSLLNDAWEGRFHYEKRLPANDWEAVGFQIRTLAHRGQMTFSVRKIGVGEPLFYLIEVDGENSCGADAIQVDE
ncbi:MAG: hypothetical protein JXX29_22785 [Deltaproteobacteria bacterium]|nr:hypothetical protein [Deltaproteobacteria bacterium]MBN2674525.1 hypothetical protein [Deltaproteobacteria bacterium]